VTSWSSAPAATGARTATSTSYHHNVDAQWNSGPLGIYAAFVGVYTDAGSGAGNSYDWGFVVQANFMINAQWELFGRYDFIELDGSDSAFAHGARDEFHEITDRPQLLPPRPQREDHDRRRLAPQRLAEQPDRHRRAGNDGENEYFIPRPVPALALTAR
jgi:hypothetical protein